MNGVLDYPKIRNTADIQLQEAPHSLNQKVIVLNCHYGLLDAPLIVDSIFAPVLACFDGINSYDDILTAFSKYGLTKDLLNDLISLLDRHFLLESASFYNKKKDVFTNYNLLQLREARLSGVIYPSDPQLLKQYLSSLLIKNSSNHVYSRETQNHSGVKIIITPHIDYQRGENVYASGYSCFHDLRDSGQLSPLFQPAPTDLCIILGIAHKPTSSLFTLTRKDFETPLGTLYTDSSFVEALAASYGHKRAFDDEYIHKHEHSIELQLPFIKHLVNPQKIVPILASGFHRFISKNVSPLQNEEYDCFISALASNLASMIQKQKNILIIVSVDMAHVGRFFGDAGSLTETTLTEVKERDSEYLDCIKQLNKEKLLNHIRYDNDKRRICGYPAVYTIIDIMERLTLNVTPLLINYQQAFNKELDCCVTFAALSAMNTLVL
jgi:MEMO1 family protein